MKVALAARTPDDLGALAQETGAKTFACDATQREQVEKLFADVEAAIGAPDVVVYNASYRTRGPLVELDPAEVEKALAVTAFGGFLVAQAAARRMLPRGAGAIFFTGASASVKGYAQSAPFAMGKFALRGLAQSMARELAPAGHPCRARGGRRRHPQRAAHGPAGQAGLLPRPRRHRRDLHGRAAPAAQRLDVGDRGAAVGGEDSEGGVGVRTSG